MGRCGSDHVWSGQTCIREAGHEGYCYGKARRNPQGAICRAHWLSVNGKFKSHHWYEMKFPANASKGIEFPKGAGDGDDGQG